MPLYSDTLRNTNSNAPCLDVNDLQVQGFGIFADTAARNALNETIRTEGYVASMKDDDKLYIYISTDLGNTAWQTTTNWVLAGGATAGVDIELALRDSAYSSIGDHEGTVLTIGPVGALAQVHYWDGTGWVLANASAATSADGLLCLGTAAAGDALVEGIMQLGSAPGSAGDVLYLDTTNGLLTATAPSASGNIVRVCGYNLGSNRVYFDPSKDWLEIV